MADRLNARLVKKRLHEPKTTKYTLDTIIYSACELPKAAANHSSHSKWGIKIMMGHQEIGTTTTLDKTDMAQGTRELIIYTLYSHFIHPSYIFVAVHTPTYTRCTCISSHHECTPNTPLNTL